MEWVEFTGKNVSEALDIALDQFGTSSDNVDYEVIEKETNGLLGLFAKPAKIRVRLKENEETEEIIERVRKEEAVVPEENTEMLSETEEIDIHAFGAVAESFLKKVCLHMGINAELEVRCDAEENRIDINIVGKEMGLLIGKRGQTLDSLQYLTSLVVNKESNTYCKVKLDTENYGARRKETLENLARNIASKVKKTKKSVELEPMNPYERRIIHSTLQNDKMVETYSQGEEPNRKVVVAMKKGYRDYNNRNNGYKKYNRNYRKSNYNRGGYDKRNFEPRENREAPAETNNSVNEDSRE
ncbi:MAG: protein jag [Lachnospiraceae bacterium]|nr:protein jag [Lachnospiraceae bacterium]